MRRVFDHLHAELSVGVGRLVSRYALWLRLREVGLDPERLTPAEALGFCRRHLGAFLAEQGLALAARPARRLERELGRFDPARPTPYERAARV
ncbi:MAG: hypothetical protein OZ948_01940 [Deltaproteobacteria bacterium]|nr:hypothetical protein [Deltaproteobacteria bacterium]